MAVGLVLSVFPGIDLFGRGFEEEGFCVVRGPDILWGGDVRRFHVQAGWFVGVVGGSPCQDFSRARRTPPTGEGLAMMEQFRRVCIEAQPQWFCLENVPGVPDLVVEGYEVQRLDVRACEFGLPQKRVRHFQIGRPAGREPVTVPRQMDFGCVTMPAAMASEGRRKGRRDWPAFCALQGLEPLALPGMTLAARYRAVGNGVAVPVARGIARAMRDWPAGAGSLFEALSVTDRSVCKCGCGRRVGSRATFALPSCRKRMERRRKALAALQK